MPDEMDELEQRWWDSLTDDQRAAVLDVDFDDDVPGWVVASLVAAHSSVGGGDDDQQGADIRPRVLQRLEEFVRRQRGS